MYCKRGIFVNWGNIPHLEVEFGPINLFSGSNGSGKTTMADGLQSLMTAAHENLFAFNPGQDETTQKGRGGKNVRTLASYILGCDDGSYARTRMTDGYVVGVFHPTSGEGGEKFTAIMSVRARLDTAGSSRQARQENILFLLLPDEELNLSDFVQEDNGGKYVVPITDIANRLKMKLGKSAVEVYDKKGPYLRRLYGMMRGLKSAVSDREAKHAARTFANFMAYKPVKSISEFVSREILEPKDLTEDIRQVSELMKTIHAMDEETRHLSQAIANLETAKTALATYVDNWIAYRVGEYSEITRQLYIKQKDYLRHKEDQRQNTQRIQETKQEIDRHIDKRRLLHEQLVELQAQRQGIEALKTKDQLEQAIDTCKKQLVQCVAPLLQQDQQFGQNYKAVVEFSSLQKQSALSVDIPELVAKPLVQSINAAIAVGEETGLNTQSLLTKDWVSNCDLEDRLDSVMRRETLHREVYERLHEEENTQSLTIREQLFSLKEKQRTQLKKLEQQVNAKRLEISNLEQKRVNYPENVESALAAIRAACPNAEPSVLCDYIEVTDAQWQMAIEGYLGGARFSIIVEPEYEAEAIRIVRALPGRRNNAKVIQGAKAQQDAAKLSLHKDSIVNLMCFEHKIAEFYLWVSYGSVICVEDEKTLRKTSRGLTASGVGSGNYSMFRCDIDDERLVFGINARERALEAKRLQLTNLSEQLANCEEQYHLIARLYELVNMIKRVECGEYIQQMIDVNQRLQQNERQLEHLDLSDFTKLEARLAELREAHDAIDVQVTQLNKSLGALDNKHQQIDRAIDKSAKEQETLQAAQEHGEKCVLDIQHAYARFDAEVALRNADEKAEKAGVDFSFVEENQSLMNGIENNDRVLYERILEHNQTSSAYTNIAYSTGASAKHDTDYFSQIVAMGSQIDGVYNSLKNNVLVGKNEKLSGLKDSFNTAFVANLCHSIYQAVNAGERALIDINKELEFHRFGADKERFYFGFDWIAEFHEYYRFFKEVINIPNLGDGESLFDIDISEKSAKVREKLLAMLLDKDEVSAMRELKRISDYRHYRRYEIYKEPENKDPIPLSTYGTGSGGQLETPAYIIRSAAVTSAFRFSEGSTHCRMVLVDEAFSKMDETRSREVMNYLTESLGLQLIFIMPTSKSGPFLDLISHQVVFAKCPTTEKIGELNSRVLVDRKICNRDKIKNLWAQHRKTIRQQAMLDFMEGISE